VSFAHVFETALDDMRSGKLAPDSDNIKVMLRASDVLSDLVLAAKGEGVVDEARARALAEELANFSVSGDDHANAALSDGSDAAQAADEWGFTPIVMTFDDAPAASAGGLSVVITPTTAMYAKGHEVTFFLRELERVGACDAKLDASMLPTLDQLEPEASYLKWTLSYAEAVSEAAVREVFDFVGDDCPIEIMGSEPMPVVEVIAPLPQPKSAPESAPESGPESAPVVRAVVSAAAKADASAPADEKANRGATTAAVPTIRVDLDRVDRMIDLVGELVINQAMLAQRVVESGLARSSNVAIGLDELEQLTREIQDSVMAIRAQPVKSVFQRMPRLVREIAGTTGKQVRLVMEGENTEVDKTIIERLSDPITHMLRNAIDHGVESPEERAAAGKSEEGVVRLAALHRSGRIVIEVSDDGRGINRPRVREIAVNKGLVPPDAQLSDDEIDNLIFLPGFSTASTISNISGRGVGMDVVKRSIQALGGRISISSIPGKGSAFSMSLPLTLAVLDGMVVSVGEQTLVAPLTAIIETLRPGPEEVRPFGPTGALLSVRGGFVPLIDVGVALGWRAESVDPTSGVCLLVESELGGRAALLVDAIQGQRQVVIKSLEANYQRVDAIAAATILGDGRVALILDVDVIIDARTNERRESQLLAQAS
jgi:two-component system chemotaxis sensor kinase CheA